MEIELEALEMTVLRVIANEAKRAGTGKPDPATSVLKIKGTEIQQGVAELLMKAAGPYAWVAGDPDAEGTNAWDVAPDWGFGLAGAYRDPTQHHGRGVSWLVRIGWIST